MKENLAAQVGGTDLRLERVYLPLGRIRFGVGCLEAAVHCGTLCIRL